MSAKKRVLVIGAGPAGLAAGCRLLEAGKDHVDVTLIHQGHHLGGKAASYRDKDGRTTEHGWHMVVGFYDEMRALMKRAGIDEQATLSPLSDTSYIYEAHDDRVHQQHALNFLTALSQLWDEALPAADRVNWNTFFARLLLRLKSGENLERHDDICADTWAVEQGLLPHLTKTSQFRFFREAYFNYPEQVSAYHVLQSARLMTTRGDGQNLNVARGGYSERIWDPIGRYFERLGGKIEPYHLVTDLVWSGRTITGVKTARPDSRGHQDGQASWKPDRIGALPGTEAVRSDFDVVISTIPHAVFMQLNQAPTSDNQALWQSPYFARLKNLRSAATVSMTLWTNTRVPYVDAPVYGFPAPLGICVDMTPHRNGNDVPTGSELWFVGQEAGFEDWSNDQIVSFTLDQFKKVPEYADLKNNVKHIDIHRNKSAFERLLLCEPGVNRFRPGSKTPFHNLFLAGDWVRNPVDLICMEGAITSGQAAAALALDAITGAQP